MGSFGRLKLVTGTMLSLLLVTCKAPEMTEEKHELRNSMLFSLTVDPLEFRLQDVSKTKIAFEVRNTGHVVIDPESHRFQLMVNDSASMVFMLRISNGIRPKEWFALPPGETATQDLSSIAPRLFPEAGRYVLQLMWKETKGKVIVVNVVA